MSTPTTYTERCCKKCGTLWAVREDGFIPPCPYCEKGEISALLPIGFYPDEKLSSRIWIMRQHWDKMGPLMQENTKLKRLLLHCLRQFGHQMDQDMSAQIAKIIYPL